MVHSPRDPMTDVNNLLDHYSEFSGQLSTIKYFKAIGWRYKMVPNQRSAM